MDFANTTIIQRLLDVTQNDILPLTEKAMKAGNLVYGAAILKKEDLSLVIAGSNHEIENPLWHGEVYTLKKFYELPSNQRPETKECIFFSSHEPCSLCLSAITWAGFDNFYYLFSYEETRDKFSMPDDLKILKEVFRCDHGNYAKKNAYWQSYHLIDLIADCDEKNKSTFLKKADQLKAHYKKLFSF